MSKEFWEHESEPLRFEEDGEAHWSGDMHESMGIHKETKQPTASSSRTCPDTGQLTSHNADDLRAQLTQTRLDRELAYSPVTSELPSSLASVDWEVVALDDELHGRDGEWLVVTEVTPDKSVLTLNCLISGSFFRRSGSAVHADIGKHHLKVHRFWADVPLEAEEYQ